MGFTSCKYNHDKIIAQINRKRELLAEASLRCRDNSEKAKSLESEINIRRAGGILEQCKWIYFNGIDKKPPEIVIKDPIQIQELEDMARVVEESKRHLDDNIKLAKKLKEEIEELEFEKAFSLHEVIIQSKVKGYDDDNFRGGVYSGNNTYDIISILVNIYDHDGGMTETNSYEILYKKPSISQKSYRWLLKDPNGDERAISHIPMFKYIISNYLKDEVERDDIHS